MLQAVRNDLLPPNAQFDIPEIVVTDVDAPDIPKPPQNIPPPPPWPPENNQGGSIPASKPDTSSSVQTLNAPLLSQIFSKSPDAATPSEIIGLPGDTKPTPEEINAQERLIKEEATAVQTAAKVMIDSFKASPNHSINDPRLEQILEITGLGKDHLQSVQSPGEALRDAIQVLQQNRNKIRVALNQLRSDT